LTRSPKPCHLCNKTPLTCTMATCRESIALEIVGTEVGDSYRRCDEHNVCGAVVEEDVVVRLRKEQMLVDGSEETAIAVYWVTGGDDRCRVGFLKRSMVMHASRYDGVLAQVTRVLGGGAPFCTAERRLHHQNMGCCYATIISIECEEGGGKGGGSRW